MAAFGLAKNLMEWAHRFIKEAMHAFAIPQCSEKSNDEDTKSSASRYNWLLWL